MSVRACRKAPPTAPPLGVSYCWNQRETICMQTCLSSSCLLLNSLPVQLWPMRLFMNRLSVPSLPWTSVMNCLSALSRISLLYYDHGGHSLVPRAPCTGSCTLVCVGGIHLPKKPCPSQITSQPPFHESAIFCPFAAASCQFFSSPSAHHR